MLTPISFPRIGAPVVSATAGSVLFVGSGVVLAEDNGDFFWDHTNKRLGVGTSTPLLSIHSHSATVQGSAGGIFVSDSTPSAAGVGGQMVFGGRFTDGSPSVTGFALFQGIKENATSGNFAGAFIIATRMNGGGMTVRVQVTSDGTSYFFSGDAPASAIVARSAASRSIPTVRLQTSAGESLGSVGGCIFDHIADVSATHTDGTLDTIYADTTVANTLGINGDKITFEYLLTIVSHATATRRIVVTFAGVTIMDSTAQVYAAAGTVKITGTIWRVTSTTCLAMVEFSPSGSSTILGYAFVTKTPPATLTALTLSGTNVLALTAAAAGTGAASADIVGNAGTVSVIPVGS